MSPEELDYAEEEEEVEEDEEAQHLHAEVSSYSSSSCSSGALMEEEDEKPRVIENQPRISPFLELIADAILTQNKRTGSSLVAILKHIQGKYGGMPDDFQAILKQHFKRFLKEGKIHCGKVHKRSYKLSKKALLLADLEAS